ncbi:MAG: DUF6702 family protein [Bacteroidota bacterium]
MLWLKLYLSVLVWMPSLHPFYVSVTEINFNESSQSLEISIKIFTEDLEQALATRYGRILNLANEGEYADADAYLALYLEDQIKIKVDGKPVSFQFLGKDANMEATWCFAEIDSLEGIPDQIEVWNSLLTSEFEGQKNMVHCKVGTKTKSLLLQRRELSGVVSFD